MFASNKDKDAAGLTPCKDADAVRHEQTPQCFKSFRCYRVLRIEKETKLGYNEAISQKKG